VPTGGEDIETLPVPELDAHATALPYLRYLLSESQMGAAMSVHGGAQLRAGRTEKSQKDLRQAAALIAATGELLPGALEAAYGKTAKSTRALIRKSLLMIQPHLEAHPRAWDEMAQAANLS
jgi:hypothetical protein